MLIGDIYWEKNFTQRENVTRMEVFSPPTSNTIVIYVKSGTIIVYSFTS